MCQFGADELGGRSELAPPGSIEINPTYVPLAHFFLAAALALTGHFGKLDEAQAARPASD